MSNNRVIVTGLDGRPMIINSNAIVYSLPVSTEPSATCSVWTGASSIPLAMTTDDLETAIGDSGANINRAALTLADGRVALWYTATGRDTVPDLIDDATEPGQAPQSFVRFGASIGDLLVLGTPDDIADELYPAP